MSGHFKFCFVPNTVYFSIIYTTTVYFFSLTFLVYHLQKVPARIFLILWQIQNINRRHCYFCYWYKVCRIVIFQSYNLLPTDAFLLFPPSHQSFKLGMLEIWDFESGYRLGYFKNILLVSVTDMDIQIFQLSDSFRYKYLYFRRFFKIIVVVFL